jgi:hypothetical protein
MFRNAFCFGLMALLLCHTPILADAGDRPPASSARASSTTKRVVWTLVGIGAGFGAGVFLGLHAFDDAINSDRKVWTSAIVGAAAGGLAAGLVSRNVGRTPRVGASGSRGPQLDLRVPPMSVVRSMASDDDLLRRRVRQINAAAVTTNQASLPVSRLEAGSW